MKQCCRPRSCHPLLRYPVVLETADHLRPTETVREQVRGQTRSPLHELVLASCSTVNAKDAVVKNGEIKISVRKIKKGDKIGIISTTNRTEWVIADYAISQIGAINVPIYPNISSQIPRL